MVGEIFAGLQSLKLVMDSLKALSEIRDETLRNDAIAAILSKLVQLNRDLLEADQAKAALTQEKRALEAKIMEMEKARSDLERYQLYTIGNGISVYMLKPDERGDAPPHWLCPGCYTNGKKAILQYVTQTGHGHLYRCGACNSRTVVGWGRPEWIG
jgi:hypothetical protein